MIHNCRKIHLKETENRLLKALSQEKMLSFEQAMELTNYKPDQLKKRLKAMHREKYLRYSEARKALFLYEK